MPNRLNLPEDLENLIEKREQEDRRAAKKAKSDSVSASRRTPTAAERRRGKRRKEDRPVIDIFRVPITASLSWVMTWSYHNFQSTNQGSSR